MTRHEAGLERDWSLVAGRLDWYPEAAIVVRRMVDVLSLTMSREQAAQVVCDVLLCLAVADLKGEIATADEHEWTALAMLAKRSLRLVDDHARAGT